mmetsp:Transcript_57690/g.108109  ORF Transcript_57690/g.108109 Transcript_57690/m.108109 type:complete len:222 (-) Transcript_57690:1604-2269(-)
MHRGQLLHGAIRHVDVQGLGLVDVRPAIRRKIQDPLLTDLPDRLVQVLHVLGKRQLLHAAIVGNELHAQLLCVEATLDEIAQEVAVHRHELSGERPPHVEVLGVWLEGLVVAQDLSGARRGHRGKQQRVPEAVPADALLQPSPVPAPALGRPSPEVKLKLTLAGWGALKGLVSSLLLRKLARSFAGGEVHRLEDVFVESPCTFALEGQAQDHERVGKPLNA